MNTAVTTLQRTITPTHAHSVVPSSIPLTINTTLHDPTRTLMLRRAFARELRKRFRALRGAIRTAIVDEDVFGLTNARLTLQQGVNTPGSRAFAFRTSQEKIDGFMEWFRREVDATILEAPQLGTGLAEPWTNVYITTAYQRGIQRAYTEMQHAGYNIPDLNDARVGGLDAVFNQPFHIDRVGILYSRTFNDLKGITSAMDTQISRILATGMAEGKNPRELARLLNRTIKGPSGDLALTDTLGRFIPAERRAEILARTEIIRAHHQATIQTYQNWSVEGVKVKAEWITAQDFRVCPECEAHEYQIYTLDEAWNIIPAHPQCRCVALPIEAPSQTPTSTEPAPAPQPTRAAQTEIDKAKEAWQVARMDMRKNGYTEERELAEKKLYYKYVGMVDDATYKKMRDETLDAIFNGQFTSLSPAQQAKLRRGTDWIPYDVLDSLERSHFRARWMQSKNFRAGYNPASKTVRFAHPTATAADIYGHEFSHAIDDLVFGANNIGRKPPGYGGGFSWFENNFIDDVKTVKRKLWDEFKSLTNGEIGTYENGDGDYFIGNFLHIYEGRIYPDNAGYGWEWWAMNCQRFTDFDNQLVSFTNRIKGFRHDLAHSTTEGSKKYYQNQIDKLMNEGQENYAARLSKWGKAREAYPELTKFIEEHFNQKWMASWD